MVWANTRHRNRRVVITLPGFTYAVILADRGDHIMLWTAYVVDEAYRRKQMRVGGGEKWRGGSPQRLTSPASGRRRCSFYAW